MNEPLPDVVFRVPASQLDELLKALRSDQHAVTEPKVVPSAGASGGGDMVAVFVELAPHALTFIAGVIATWVTRPRASVEVDGIKVQNVSERLVEEILREHLVEKRAPDGDDKEAS